MICQGGQCLLHLREDVSKNCQGFEMRHMLARDFVELIWQSKMGADIFLNLFKEHLFRCLLSVKDWALKKEESELKFALRELSDSLSFCVVVGKCHRTGAKNSYLHCLSEPALDIWFLIKIELDPSLFLSLPIYWETEIDSEIEILRVRI